MQDSYQTLPTRHNNQHKCTLRLQRLPNKYYLYTPQTPIDHSVRGLFKHHLRYTRNQPNSFYEQIGFICCYQNGLLGHNELNTTHTIQLNEAQQNIAVTSIVLVRQREVQLNQLISSNQGIRFIRATFNKALTRILSNKQNKVTLHKHKQFIFQSSRKITLFYAHFNNKIWITTDAVNRVQEHTTILEYIAKYKVIESTALLKGAKIVKNYGKMECCYLLDIDCSKNPTHNMGNHSKLTYQEYYLQKYNIKIKDTKQPLILASKIKLSQQNNAKTEYLIPQLVSLCDKTYIPDCPQFITNQLKQLKLITPQQKEQSISNLVQQMSAEDIIKKSAINLDAQQLNVPCILTKNKEMLPQDGVFQFRSAIRQSPQMRSWAIAYSESISNERQEVDNLLDYFRSLTKIYGVNITSNPSFVVIQGSTLQAWQASLQQNFKNYGKLQIIILFLKEQQQKHYYQLKQLLTLKIKCPSQVICKNTFSRQKCKKPYAVATDVLLQIINKIGAIPWEVKRQPNLISTSIVMHGGLSISKNAQGYNFSLVGTGGKQQSQVHSQFKKNLKPLDSFKISLQNCLMVWAKSFVVSCRNAPNTIILYVHCSPQTMSKQIRKTLEATFFALAAKIGQKTKQQSYNPNMAFINVSTRHKMQFYSRQMLASDFILKNVNSGTVVYEQLDTPNSYNFYLCSKTTAFQTSIKPVKYSVLSNNQNIKREQLSQFTYESCYCYFNYQGAALFPAMLQSSIKLGKISSKFSSAADPDQRMARLPYYM